MEEKGYGIVLAAWVPGLMGTPSLCRHLAGGTPLRVRELEPS
jgi:hypothetical protein